MREISAAVSLHNFERQLRHLRRRYRVVPASCLAEAAAARTRGRRVPVAITFDDDLPSHLSHAAPALRRARLSATFFLSGAGLNGPFSFWWQLLQRAWDRGLVDAPLLHAWGIQDQTCRFARSPAVSKECPPPNASCRRVSARCSRR